MSFVDLPNKQKRETMIKTVTIIQTSPDSIDTLDSIQIEIDSVERRLTFSATHYQPAEYDEAHITRVSYEGVDISGVIDEYFTESELLNVNDGSELETEKNLFYIKRLADEFAMEDDYKYQPYKP